MEKEIVYLESEGFTVKKEGKNFGKVCYKHRFMLGSNVFNTFEFANEQGVYKFNDFIRMNGVERLNVLNGKFDVYVNNQGNLSASLVEIERVL